MDNTEQGSHRLVRMQGKTKYIYHSNCETLYARRWMHVIGGDNVLVANSYMISRSLMQGIPVILVHGGTLEQDRSELSEFWTFALNSKAIIDRHHTSATYTLNTYDGLAFDRFLKGELTIQGHGHIYAPCSGRQLNIIIDDVALESIKFMNKYSYSRGNLNEYLRGHLEQINLQHGITDLKKQK